MLLKTGWAALAALAGLMIGGAGAEAAWPVPWQMNFQDAATPIMERIVAFHDMLLWIIFSIAIFVLILMIVVMVRFRASRNPTPSRTVHNTLLEVAWTVAPVLILVLIAIPSFKLLYFEDRVPDAEMTLKVTGHQWYWTYQYPDNGGFEFDSFLVCRTPEECTEAAQGGVTPRRLLDTDNRVIVPVNTTVRVLLTAADVIHSWAVPSLGIKTDTIPGRLNETWFRIKKEGVYYGQCSELCGIEHGFMPIAVEAVSKEAFDAWVAKAKVEFARDDAPALPVTVAQRGAQK